MDYLLASSGLLNTVLSTDISPGYRSDHSMISTSFKLCCVSLGRGYWKFNNSLLKDEIYVKLIKKVIDDTIDDYGCLLYNRENISNIHRQNIIFTISDQLFFLTLLINIRGKSISYSSSVKKEKQNRERFFLGEIQHLENKYAEDSNMRDRIDTLKQELEAIREEKLKGNMIRSRVQWIDEGEKPSKFFLN